MPNGCAHGWPIAPYAIATVPDALMEDDLTSWLRDLGAGEAFASRRVNAVALTEAHRDRVPPEQQLDVSALDGWVHNSDRNLTALG